jgi:hypothetical protein
MRPAYHAPKPNHEVLLEYQEIKRKLNQDHRIFEANPSNS